MRIEFKINDAWIGAFWRTSYHWARIGAVDTAVGSVITDIRPPIRPIRRFDLWLCVLPCLPVHFTAGDNFDRCPFCACTASFLVPVDVKPS